MSEEPRRKNTKAMVVGAALILFVVGVTVEYGSLTILGLTQLQVGFPSIDVKVRDYSIDVTFTLPVSNPRDVSLPSITMLIDVEIDGSILFRQQEKSLGGLNAHSTILVLMEQTATVGTKLFNVLSNYLTNGEISYTFHCKFSVHTVNEYQFSEVNRQGTFRL